MRNLLEIWKAVELGRNFHICKVSAGPSQVQLILVTHLLTVAFMWWGSSWALSFFNSYQISFSFSGSWARVCGALKGKGLASWGHSHNQDLKWWETDNVGTSLSSQVCLCSSYFAAGCAAWLPALLTYSNFRPTSRCSASNPLKSSPAPLHGLSDLALTL